MVSSSRGGIYDEDGVIQEKDRSFTNQPDQIAQKLSPT